MTFRKTRYRSIEELRGDLETWLESYTTERPHQGRWCDGETPRQTFLDSMPLAKETLLAV